MGVYHVLDAYHNNMIGLKKLYKWTDYILPLYFIITLPELYFGAWGIFVLCKYFAFFLLLLMATRVMEQSSNSSNFKSVFSIYFFYCILSVIWYAGNDVSIQCYKNEVFNSLPAMFFVYVGMAEKRDNNRFYKYFLYFCTVSMVIGFFLYLTVPGWYIARKTEQYNNQWFNDLTYNEDEYLQTMRFSSYLGSSYNVDFFALLAISISLFALYYAYKNAKNPLIAYICYFINFLAAILSQMRVAMAYAVIATILFIYFGYKTKNSKASNKLLGIIIFGLMIVVTVGITRLGERGDFLQTVLLARLDDMSFLKALGERSYQMDLLANYWYNPIFGHGIGSGGSVARSMGYPAVSDCYYIELLFENGIIGFLLFVNIMVKTLKRAYRNYRYYAIELAFIGFVLCACIGSNTLSMSFICVFPFWYCIGRVWNDSYLASAKINNISI